MKYIKPVEGWLLVLRSRHLNNPSLVEELSKANHWGLPLVEDQEDRHTAGRALFEKMVTAGNVEAWGVLKRDAPAIPIPAPDLAAGKLDIWNRTIDCSNEVGRLLIYHNLSFSEEDILRQTEPGASAAEPEPKLKPAPLTKIRKACQDVYDKAERDGTPQPNNRRLPEHVMPILAAQGFITSKRKIENVGREFKHRRRPRGPTLANERRARGK
jgi:hypothetical protein